MTPLRVLFVEDSEVDTAILVHELRRGGFAVTFDRVETAEAMALALAKQDWDLVISDHNLPQFDSLKAVALVRESGKDLPFIIVSGALGEDVAVAAMKAGAHDYVMKDNLARLLPSVERELRETRQRQARREAEQSLHESEELFRKLSESSPVGIYLTDAAGQYVYTNPRWRGIYGLTIGASLGDGWSQSLHPDDRPKVLEQWTACARAGREYDQEFRLRLTDGTVRWIHSRASAMRNEAGQVTGLVGTIEDISERKRAERTLRLTRFSFDHASDAIFWVGADARILYVNHASCQQLGYSRDELLSLSFHDIAEDLSADRWPEHWRELKLRRSLTLEGRHRRKDGNFIPVEINANYLQFEGVEYDFAFVRDIRERKRAEEALHSAQARLQHLLSASSAVIYSCEATSDYAINFVSSNVAALLGYRPEQFTHDRHFWSSHLHPEDRARVLAELPRVFVAEHYTHEYRFLRQNGSACWIRDQRRLVRRPTGEPQEVVGFMSDITEHKELEGQFLQAQKMEAVGRLAGGVAHDFNNILTAIIGFNDLVQQGVPENSRALRHLREIGKAADRAATLTRQLLAFSRRQMLTPKIVELNTLIHEVQPMLQRLIGEDIELHTSLAAEASYILADPGQVEQVVINLAVNARDAMPGGGHLTLETATVTFDANDALQQPGLVPGNYVGLVIRDTGTGMSEQVKHHLFEPFFTTKEQGRGTGLGLATCYGIVKQSGGHIAVESELGHGTAFHIFLPRQEAPAATPGTAAAHEQLHHGTETILVAEDDEMVRELIVTTLRGLGYHVLEAENGMAALALVEMCGAENIQLLLTDVVMPGMSGKLLADRVRDLNPQIKILFCSGYTDDTILQHRIHELQAVLLPKPFNSVTLAQQVAEVLHAPAVTAAT